MSGAADGRAGGTGLVHRWSEWADALAFEQARDPFRALRIMLLAVAVSMIVGIPFGLVLFDDPALWLREIMPGTLLNGTLILAAAVAARAAHRRLDPPVPWYKNFWGLSALMLLGLAIVELFQPTAFVGHFLQDDQGWDAPGPIEDMDAVAVLTVLAIVGIVLIPRALVLFRPEHRTALILMCCALVLAAASAGCDSLLEDSDWEFVLEDNFKGFGAPFLVAAYLAAVKDIGITRRA